MGFTDELIKKSTSNNNNKWKIWRKFLSAIHIVAKSDLDDDWSKSFARYFKYFLTKISV